MLLFAAAVPGVHAQDKVTWRELPPIPDPVGFAGSYAGVSKGALIVAGGANFPGRPPWEGGEKVWHDTVFVLPAGTEQRIDGGRLPQASGYGLSLTTPEGVLLIGGGGARQNHPTVWRARCDGERVQFENLPALPHPLAMLTGALVGRTVYVTGGLAAPDATTAESTFLALDLDQLDQGWTSLESWAGPERFYATGGSQDGALHLFGGARLVPGPDGKPTHEWLRDAWRYTPGAGWRRLADLPTPLVGTPGPAPAVGPAHLLLIGGDDGSLTDHPPTDHPGFPRNLWAYHTITDRWVRLGELPFSLVTTTATRLGEEIVIAGGEARPGVRSPAVWTGRVEPQPVSFGWLNYTTLALYLAAVAGVGLWFMRRQRSTQDYFKGGGRVPWWIAGLSIFATMLSSFTYMAVPAKSYSTDWVFWIGSSTTLMLAPIVVAFYLPRFRRLNVTTAYEYLEQRFNLPARLYASASFILFQLGRMAIVIYLPALALSAALGIDVMLCVLFIGVTCAIYTAAGGIEADVWTDALQAIVQMGAAVFSLILIAFHLDGMPAEWLHDATSAGRLHLVNWSWDLTSASLFVVLLGNLLSNFAPYTADQAVVQRYITTADPKQAERAIWLNGCLAIPATALFFAIGTALFLYYRQHPEQLDPTLETDSIFPFFISRIMPPGVVGIVIAGIFAAAQSTASSSVNSISTALVTDWLLRFYPGLSDRFCLRVGQALAVLLGFGGTGLALFLATTDVKSLWDAYLGLLGLLGSGLAGLFALGIFCQRATGAGALTGSVSSALILYWVQHHTSIHFLLYGAVGTISCFVIGYAASLLLPDRRAARS